MPRYTHSFDTRVCIIFDSDIEDFDDALNAKFKELAASSHSQTAVRDFLLDGDESTKTLIEGIIYNQTDDNEQSPQL